MRRCPGAKGLYTFYATYRLVADVLPHLVFLSKIFQKPRQLSTYQGAGMLKVAKCYLLKFF